MTDFDIYNNRIPLGLLSAEERTALMAHDGDFEWWNAWCIEWLVHDKEYCLEDALTYRAVKPAPTPDVYPWDALDDQIVAVARDRDGDVYGYTDEDVEFSVIRWNTRSPGQGENSFNLTGIVKITIGTCDWRDSLQLRPKEATK